MVIYFSGIGGVGIGPLAMIALDCGWKVYGSDIADSDFTEALSLRGAQISIGQQDGTFFHEIKDKPDYYVHSSAVKPGSAELETAKKLGIPCIKRDSLINIIMKEKNLKMVAVAGTHGKTTTTAMVVWLMLKLNLPVSYSIGSTINFGPSGKFEPGSQFFIYEADEYDRNFLNFNPYLSLITNIDYDHPDIYQNRSDYIQAFEQFKQQSSNVIESEFISPFAGLKLSGHNKNNASLAINAILKLDLCKNRNSSDLSSSERKLVLSEREVLRKSSKMVPEQDLEKLIEIASQFPGTGRRMESLADRIYSDYAHTPTELYSTMALIKEMYPETKVSIIYQPHQNQRQLEIVEAGGYKDTLSLADKIYWLPTYLTRENSDLALTNLQLIETLSNKSSAEPAEMNRDLTLKLSEDYRGGSVIIFFGAGDIDAWARAHVEQITKQN